MTDDFVETTVVKAWEEGSRLHGLLLETPVALRERHGVPGQYVRARVAGAVKEAFLALANAPGGPFELLVQVPSPPDPARAADRIATLRAGGTLAITAPGGKGFPVDGEKGRDLLLFAGGSGISAIRSVVEHVAARRNDWGRVILFFGARRVEDLAYRAAFEGWRAAKVEVEPSLSRPAEGWTGRRGYVQAALAEVAPDPKNASAFLAGGKDFSAAVVGALTNIGVERIFKNF